MKNELGCEPVECCNGIVVLTSYREEAEWPYVGLHVLGPLVNRGQGEQVAKENDVKSMRNF